MIVWRIFDANDSFLRVHAFLESCCKHMQTSRNYACTRNNFFILHAHASIYRFSWARSRLLSCTLIHNGIQFLLIDIKRSSSPISTTPQFCNFLFAKSSTQSSNQGHLWGDCLSIIHAPTSTNKSKNVELFAVSSMRLSLIELSSPPTTSPRPCSKHHWWSVTEPLHYCVISGSALTCYQWPTFFLAPMFRFRNFDPQVSSWSSIPKAQWLYAFPLLINDVCIHFAWIQNKTKLSAVCFAGTIRA